VDFGWWRSLGQGYIWVYIIPVIFWAVGLWRSLGRWVLVG